MGRIAYFDCFSGVSGDMTLGALLACGLSADDLRADLARLNLSGWELDVQETSQNGIGALDVHVRVTEEQGHGRHLHHIEEILGKSDLPEGIRRRAYEVFSRLADAEAKIHQTTRERIHFHEVGAIDAIVDIVGACIALERLGVDEVYSSPLPMGRGFIECMHGTIPLPAPATLEILAGVPVYDAGLEGELVTPTGAAILRTLAKGFGPMPRMKVAAAGYGAGKNRFGNRPNLLRVILGESVDAALTGAPEVTVIETNLDDYSPQFYAPLMDQLFAAGAMDVYLTPVQMKKGRPGTLLTVAAPRDRVDILVHTLFRETTTLGLRFGVMRRVCLDREWETVDTEYGPIRVKTGSWKGERTTASPEYEDVRRAAEEKSAPVKEVYAAAVAAYHQSSKT